MLVWTTDRIYWEHHTNKKTGEQNTIGLGCRCGLCGPVKDRAMPLVRFDRVRLDEQPDRGYPRVGICGNCISKAQRAIDHYTDETGMVRIGSPYDCSCCKQRVTPVVWFDTTSVQEQYICARCLVGAQKQILIEQEDLREQRKHLDCIDKQ
ncbi:hypothetical protein LCGC14_0698950 [marine sediment metagenome]|uniref:Uncharacterized protein n=1 Tax=marine sediment metagenome TaxID=412755 RepID=A0A0F9T4D8_9ZZZZ